jgi:hypothetical protein
MKRVILALLVALSLYAAPARAQEYEISVVGTPLNVTDYRLYSDSFPAGHAGPGEFFYYRIGNYVHVWGKLDVQPTTANVQFSIQLSLPYASVSPNYAYWVGVGNSPGGTRSGAIFASQTGVEGNNMSVVFKAVPNDTALRAYAIVFDYEVVE